MAFRDHLMLLVEWELRKEPKPGQLWPKAQQRLKTTEDAPETPRRTAK